MKGTRFHEAVIKRFPPTHVHHLLDARTQRLTFVFQLNSDFRFKDFLREHRSWHYYYYQIMLPEMLLHNIGFEFVRALAHNRCSSIGCRLFSFNFSIFGIPIVSSLPSYTRWTGKHFAKHANTTHFFSVCALSSRVYCFAQAEKIYIFIVRPTMDVNIHSHI